MFKKNWPYLLVVIVILLAFSPIIFGNESLFIFYGDSFEQLYQYFLGAWLKFHQFNILGFDFSVGLGVNFFATIFYTFTPFFWLQLMLPKEFIKYSFLMLSIMKLIILFFTSNLWLSEITKSRNTRILTALLVTFSGWVIFYLVVGFVDFFVFYPICLYFIERYLKYNRKVGLVISVALLCMMNYYFAYMFIPFACLYALMRYCSINDNLKFTKVLLNGLQFLGWILLAVAISSWVLLPSYYVISLEPRLQESFSIFDHISKYDIFSIISSLISPVFDRFQANAFIHETNRSFLGWNGGATLFMGVLPLIIVPLFIFIKDRKERLIIAITYGVAGLMMYFFIFYRILQGAIESRWFYMIVLINAYVFAKVLDNIKNQDIAKNKVIYTSVIWFILVVICFMFSKKYEFFQSVEIMKLLINSLILMSVLVIVYCLLFMFDNKLRYTIIFIICTFECGFYLWQFITNNQPIEKQYLLDAEDTTAIDYIKDIDDGFYRIIYGTDGIVTANEPGAKDFNGTTFYSSLYNFEQKDYLARFLNTWSLPQYYGRTNTDNLVGVKYYYTKNNLQAVPYGFEFLKRVGDYDIYENLYPYTLGYATTKTLNKTTFDQLSYLDQDRLLIDYIITDDSDNYEYQFSNELEFIGTYTGSDIFIEIPANSDMTMIFETDKDTSLKIQTLNNWQENGNYYFNQLHYSSIYFPKDQYVTQINIAQSNPESTLNVYIDKPNEYYPEIYKGLDQFYDVEINQSHIKSKIDVDNQNSTVFTSIPYDIGWKLKVNGKNITYQKVDGGFIGFKIDAGNYDVEFTYSPPLLDLGIVVSVISTAIFIILVRNKK